MRAAKLRYTPAACLLMRDRGTNNNVVIHLIAYNYIRWIAI